MLGCPSTSQAAFIHISRLFTICSFFCTCHVRLKKAQSTFLELQSMLGIGQRRLQDVDALFQMLRCQMAVPQGHADVAVSGQRRDFC